MPETSEPYRNPYTAYPGTSTASPALSPAEGTSDLWAFFWLAIANSAIIGVAGVIAWYLVHHHP